MEILRRPRRWLAGLALAAFAGAASGQVVAPPPPAEYDVELHYRIRAPRNERIRQFLQMTRDFDTAGLVRAPSETDDALDPNAERLRGRLAATKLPHLLLEPHVLTVLLVPAGTKLPDAADARVPVRIDIVDTLPTDRQQLLHDQTRARVAKLGFVENVGYDHRRFSRLFGSIPVGVLPLLLNDLRRLPGGWLLPETATDALPEPIRSISPLRVITVEPLAEGVALATDAAAPTIDPAQVKLSPDLIALLKSESGPATKTRLDVILFDTPDPADPNWRNRLATMGYLTFEGIAGQIVTVNTTAGAALELAKLPEVATIRLPVRASPAIGTSGLVPSSDAFSGTNLWQLHNLGGQGRGVKLAIVDSDFAGLQRYLGKSLPPQTKLLDLTAERNSSLLPDALASDRPGRGTTAALVAAKAAPQAELILIRVDEAAPHQVLSVARALAGEAFRTEAMRVRHGEVLIENDLLRQSREQLTKDRAIMADNFDSSDAAQKRRVELDAKLVQQDRNEREYSARLARFTELETSLWGLRSASVMANNLNWLDGLPADGFGPLASYLDGPARLRDRKRQPAATWVQSPGDTNGQVWAGPMSDVDANGVLEFAPQQMPIPSSRWTRELNFITWAPHEGNASAELPAGAQLRLTVQWTEAHDADAAVDPQRWRTPLTKLQPILLRQRDPLGKKISSDDLVVVARTAELPHLLARGRGWATFEHVIEFTSDQAGVYAVRLEGRAAAATIPPETPSIPASRSRGEAFPRMTISVNDAPSRESGRPVFSDFRGHVGGSGSPADAHDTIVVGASDRSDQPQSYSPFGSAPALALVHRPTFLAPDEFQFGGVPVRGTAQANGFAAGTLAAMLSVGAPPSTNLSWLQIKSGSNLVVPQAWLDQVAQRPVR